MRLNNYKNVLRVREVLAKQEIRSLPREVCGYSVFHLSALYNVVKKKRNMEIILLMFLFDQVGAMMTKMVNS